VRLEDSARMIFSQYSKQKTHAPVLLILGALALFIFAISAYAQQRRQPRRTRQRTVSTAPTVKQQPAPVSSPSPLSSPSPSPTPTPPLSIPKPSPTSPVNANDDDDEVIRVTSNLVVVPVSVTDATNQPVLHLNAADFQLEEAGRAQQIAQIVDAEQVPLEIAILLDVSGSVNARFAFEKEAAARFLKQTLKPADHATIYAIDAQPRLEQTRAGLDIATARLLAIQPAKSSTAFYDTVVDATRYLAKAAPTGARRVIVVISDGEDTNSEKIKAAREDATTIVKALAVQRSALAEVQRELQRADAIFYSLNPSGQALRLNVISTRAQEGMQQFATATGGAAFVPERETDLDLIFRQIANELRSQYLLQYYSQKASPSGTFLGIKVSTPARTNLRIRARQGYYTKNR
jgi:Ca-activated chloride channel family protein